VSTFKLSLGFCVQELWVRVSNQCSIKIIAGLNRPPRHTREEAAHIYERWCLQQVIIRLCTNY
jgi:hypothetical protein